MIIDKSKKPMMADHEIKIVDDLLKKHKPKICLEFGSGNSTVYFPNKHRFIKQWVAIEHGQRYAKHISRRANNEKVVLIWIPNDQKYVDCLKHQTRKYNFIFIDGKQRKKCLEMAMTLVKENGIILLHDSARKEYESWIEKYPHKVLCEGEKTKTGEIHRGLTLYEIR